MGERWGTWQEARTGEVCSGQLDLLLDPVERAETGMRSCTPEALRQKYGDNDLCRTPAAQVTAERWGFLALPRASEKDGPLKEAFVSRTSCPRAFAQQSGQKGWCSNAREMADSSFLTLWLLASPPWFSPLL